MYVIVVQPPRPPPPPVQTSVFFNHTAIQVADQTEFLRGRLPDHVPTFPGQRRLGDDVISPAPCRLVIQSHDEYLGG